MSSSLVAVALAGSLSTQAFAPVDLPQEFVGDLQSELGFTVSDPQVAAAHVSAAAGAPIVVLGAQLNADCSAPGVLSSRVDRAAGFVRVHPLNPVVVTGGATRDGCVTEAQAMAAQLRGHGVVNPIVLENSAGSTVQNASNVAAMRPERHMVLVTSQDHLPRASQNFAAVGISTAGVPAF